MRRSIIFSTFAAGLLLAGCSSASKRLLADDPQVRSAALDEVLRSDEKTRRKAALRMKKILARKDSPDRLYAVSALEDLGQSAAPAVPELMAALSGGDLVSYSAARALSKLDAAAPALLEALKSTDPALRREAARILPAHGALAAPGLAKNLQSADPALAEESARILGEMGEEAKDAVPALARLAYSGKKDLKIQASIALGRIGPAAGKWLAAAMRAPDGKIRSGAARVLADMSPPSPEAAAALAAALEDPDAGIRADAARALGAYPAGTQALFPETYISALVLAARAPEEDARGWASIALGRIGAPAGKYLAKALTSPDPAARSGAMLVISRMFPPPPDAAAALPNALKDGDPAVRLAAAEALGTYAMTAPRSLPKNAARELAEALKDKDAALRAAVIFPLSRLAPKSRLATAALIGALKDRDLEVRRSAASAVGTLGPAAEKALPALRENLKSRDCSLRLLSARALIAIDPAFKRNVAAVRASKTVCPGVKVMPRIEPLTATAEVALDSATINGFLPLQKELSKYSTGQLPDAR
jgi:HEAT repeat protein